MSKEKASLLWTFITLILAKEWTVLHWSVNTGTALLLSDWAVVDSSVPISCFQGQQKMQRQHIQLPPEGCQCFAWFESLTSPYDQRSLSMGRLPREFSRDLLEGKMMPEIWQGERESYLGNQHGFTTPTKKKITRMVKLGLEIRSAVLLPQA